MFSNFCNKGSRWWFSWTETCSKFLYNVTVSCMHTSFAFQSLFNSEEYNSGLVQNMICGSIKAQSHIFYSLGSSLRNEMFGVSYLISHPPPPHDADRESRSDCAIGPEAYVYASLDMSMLYRVASSELKIQTNWFMTQGKATEYSCSKVHSVRNQLHYTL
jgi:hypothetical protein